MKKKHTLRRAPSSCVRENLFMTSFLHRDTSVTNFCCSQGQWLASQFVSAIRKIVLNSSECFPNDRYVRKPKVSLVPNFSEYGLCMTRHF